MAIRGKAHPYRNVWQTSDYRKGGAMTMKKVKGVSEPYDEEGFPTEELNAKVRTNIMNQYTPGPWEVERDEGNLRYVVRYVDPDRGIGSHVATCYDMALCEEHGDVESNARLIAAAPELLEAAKLMCKVWPDQTRGSLLEEAIRKAEGG